MIKRSKHLTRFQSICFVCTPPCTRRPCPMQRVGQRISEAIMVRPSLTRDRAGAATVIVPLWPSISLYGQYRTTGRQLDERGRARHAHRAKQGVCRLLTNRSAIMTLSDLSATSLQLQITVPSQKPTDIVCTMAIRQPRGKRTSFWHQYRYKSAACAAIGSQYMSLVQSFEAGF